jgi:geranylgeranyl diphosphate synthase, type II
MVNSLSLPLADHANRLRPAIEEGLDQSTAGLRCPPRLAEAMRYALLAPGKRVRPMLALMAAEACGGTIEAAMPAACAVEMVHAYSLVHDDLPAMDDDDLRRGRPTCHKVFGEAVAILAGDALLAHAFTLLATRIRPPTTAAACCAALAEAAGPCQLVGGQADDMAGPQTGANGNASPTAEAEVAALESIHHRKTGAMIRVSLKLGALTAKADAQQLAALDEYGRRLGLAFQVVDDLLDACGEEMAVGKRVGKDHAQGKRTYPVLLGVPRSRAYAEELISEACAALAVLGPRADGLDALARYVLHRNG